MKKFIAIVSARGGSKGIKKKNLQKINKKPLIFYTLNTLVNSNIDEVIFSSDSDEIINEVKKFKLNIKIFKRPLYLADDKTALTDVVKYTAHQFSKKYYKPDVVFQVAATCPFLKVITINDTIKKFKKNKNIECCVTLKRIEHEHPYRAKKILKNGIFEPVIKNKNVEKFISRQDLPLYYCTSGSLYARNYSLLMKFNNKDFCLGKKPHGIIVDDIESINIDRQVDLDFARFIYKKLKFN
jgi:CMP-N,N'-diacetyllegionaminic acid synthase